jgi:hypothetical protein
MKLLSLLLIALIIGTGFVPQPATRMKINAANMQMMKLHPHKGDCCNNNKKNANSTFCNFCVLCVAFIAPVNPGVQRNFVPVSADYPEMVQSKLTDYNSSQWRPPSA